MKYFTKEYYDLIDKGCLQLDFVSSPSAKKKSENYFKHLYAEKQKVFLDAGRERAAEKGVAFDEGAAKEDFACYYENQMNLYSHELPEEILAQVADMRVLSLGVCTGKVKQQISKFSKKKMAEADAIEKRFEDYMERRYRHLPEEILENYGFFNEVVTGLTMEGDTLTLTLDHSHSRDDVYAVIWKKAKILTQEPGIVGSVWISEELYKVPEGYEFHAVLENPEGEMLYLTVQAESVEFLIDEEKRRRIQEETEGIDESSAVPQD